MSEPWIPDHDRTRVTQNGSTVSGLDDTRFKDIGKLAHELGELKKHGEPLTHASSTLKTEVDKLIAGLEFVDQVQVELAVEAYIDLAAMHPEGSRLCTRDPHHEVSKLASGKLYEASGLAADFMKVCP